MREFLIFGACIIICIVVFVTWTLLSEKRRAQAMMQVAKSMGFDYSSGMDTDLRDGLERLPIFALAGLTRWHSIANVLRGNSGGLAVMICDYHYATGTPSNRRDYYHTVVAFQTGPAALPEFTLRRSSGPFSVDPNSKLVGALTGLLPQGGLVREALQMQASRQVTIESHPEFERNYNLHGGDEPALRNLFRSAVIEELMRAPVPISIDSGGGWLAIFTSKYVSPKDLWSFLDESTQVASLLLEVKKHD